MTSTARIGLLLAGALTGCGYDWGKFTEADGGAHSDRYSIKGTFAGGRAQASGGGYELRGQLVWRAARQSGGRYTIEGGLR